MTNKLLLAQSGSKYPDLWYVIGYIVETVTLLDRPHEKLSSKGKNVYSSCDEGNSVLLLLTLV